MRKGGISSHAFNSQRPNGSQMKMCGLPIALWEIYVQLDYMEIDSKFNSIGKTLEIKWNWDNIHLGCACTCKI